MKNLKNKLLFTFIATFIFTFIGIVVFQSCDSNNNVTSDTIESSLEEFKIPETVSNAYVDGLKLPDGTKVIKIDDSTVEFTYPKGVELWIGDDNGNVSKKYISGGYTCTCSGENGCNVFYAGGNFGCQHATCTGTCTGKHAKITNPKDLNYVFVNTNESLVPINNDYDFENSNGPQVGDKAYDFELMDASGNPKDLLDFEGDFLVLELGSITCPLFQARRNTMMTLQDEFPQISNSIL